MSNQLKKIKNSNQDVSNQSPQAKHDCADVANIPVFLME